MVEAHQHGFGHGNGLAVARQLVMHVHAFRAEVPNVAVHLQGVAEANGLDVVDGMVGHQNTDFGPIPSPLSHRLTPPMDAGLFHVNDVGGVVHNAIGVDIAESDFGTIGGDLLHGAKVL